MPKVALYQPKRFDKLAKSNLNDSVFGIEPNKHVLI